MTSKKIELSVIYVYYNCPKEIVSSLISLNKELIKFNSEIIIVDNNSSIPIPKTIVRQKNIMIITNLENKGYGKALNQGAKIAKGKYLLLLNPDTLFKKKSISLMVQKMNNNLRIGILGPQLFDENGAIQNVGTDFPLIPEALFSFSFLNKLMPNNYYSSKYYLSDFDRTSEKIIPVICGACMLIRKDVFIKIGGFDEQFFMYFEEADICYRLNKAGYYNLYYPAAKVIHFIGRSSSDKKLIKKHFERSRYKFLRKYNNVIVSTIVETFLRIVNSL